MNGCSEGITRQVEAIILSSRGDCVLRRGGLDAPLDVDMHPRAGDLLETGSTAELSAALLPNVLIELAPSSALQITTLSLSKDGNDTIEPMRARVAHARLLRGSVTVSQRRLDVVAEPSLRIETPHGAAISSYDCLFRIETDTAATRLACEEGYVYLVAPDPRGAPRQVNPGFVGEIAAASGDVALREGDGASQAGADDLGAIESRLAQLLAAETQAPPPWMR